MKLTNQTLIVICGWPISGKSTLAKIISEQLGIWNCDIDGGRLWLTGLPHPHPNESPELMDKDRLEMRAAYLLLNAAADLYCGVLRRSLIVTAAFSQKKGQEDIRAVYERYPHVKVRVVWCLPTNDTDKEIQRRLSCGFGEGGYVGGVNSLERYHEVKDRFEPIELPCATVDTSPPHTPEESAEEALQYILS